MNNSSIYGFKGRQIVNMFNLLSRPVRHDKIECKIELGILRACNDHHEGY